MSWIGDKAEAAANVLKELLMQTPAARIARGDLPNVLADLSRTAEEDRKRSLGRVRDAYVGREVNFTPEELESTSAFWNPAGMLGKIVYHGSPHKFDKFDASKIGTGEGAQAYGHGVYLADSEGVGKDYAWNLSQRLPDRLKVDGKPIPTNTMLGRALEDVAVLGKDASLQKIDDSIRFNEKYSPDTANMYRSVKDMVANIDPAKIDLNRGSLYKADLPDEWIPKMLDWDKPLKEQPEILSKFSDEVLDNLGVTRSGMDAYAGKPLAGGDLVRFVENQKGKGALANYGIPGIRYLDGGSRPNSGRITMLEQTIANLQGKGASKAAISNAQRELDAEIARASYNYVVFPGLEDKVKILERNGQPVNALAEILK